MDNIYTLYSLSRGLAAFFGFAVLLGVLWFVGSPGGGTHVVPNVVLGLGSIAAAFVPQRKLANTATRRTLVTLCVVAIGAGLVLIAADLQAARGIEWDLIAIRFVHIAALATLATKSLRARSDGQESTS